MRTVLILFLIFSSALFTQAQLPAGMLNAIQKIEPKCIKWREHLHQYPELGNREKNTAKMVADHLRSLGLEVQEGVAHTGVVGLLKGDKPGPCIAFRADMDGLPITERVNIPFASKEKSTYDNQEVGVMHACGHDAHVAILMAFAEIMSAQKSKINGSIKFIFQPAEEGPPPGEEGGALMMVQQNVMENPKVDAIFGLHINSAVPVGTVQYKSGSFMAAADFFTVKIKGKGSHGSQPWLGIDPIAISAQVIQGLQNIVSRQSALTKAPVVITVGKIESGVRNNIIPEEATMLGTIRTLDSKMQEQVHIQFRQVINKITEAHGATADVQIDTRTLVTYNDPELLKKMLPALQKSLGEENVQEREWVTGAEDFSYYGTKAPSLFLYLGGMAKNQDPTKAAPHHTPEFRIENESLKTGIQTFCTLAAAYLKIK